MGKIISALVFGIFIISCGSNDLQTKLRELEAQRDALNTEIESIKKVIAKSNGNSINKITYVEIKNVVPTEFKHYIKVQGTIESDNNILIPPKSAGIVKRIYVKEGDRVQKEQLLAELDGAIYESTIAELKTGLEMATTVFERQERLWNKKIGSEIQYLQAKTNKESLEQKLKTVNEQYKLTKITAPISGTVDQILIKEGEAAAAGIGAIRIVQLTELKIKANLSENYISYIKAGDLVNVHIPVLDKNLSLKIDAVSQVVDAQNRTFSVEMKIPKNEPEIKPNMLAVLTINDYTNPNALTVPIDIVQKTGAENFLFTVKNNPQDSGENWQVEKRFVNTGKKYNEQIEITDGLSKNESVVVVGFQNLADGQVVHVNNK